MPTNSYSADTTKASAKAAFRLQNMRAQEQLDVLPTQAKAVQFADLLLAELDGIAASEAAVPKMAVTGVKLVQTVMFSRRTVDVLCAAAKATSAHDQNKEKKSCHSCCGWRCRFCRKFRYQNRLDVS